MFETLHADCEALIRAGRGFEAAKRLADVNAARVPRVWRRPLANLARRVGLNRLGLRLLTPVVHESHRRERVTPDAREIAEYGVLLQNVGSVREGLQLLRALDPAELPERDLYVAFGLFIEWDYETAIPFLRRFCIANVSEYQALIGRVNLAAALVMTEAFDEAQALLEETTGVAQAAGAQRLQANCREMLAQIAIEAGVGSSWPEAETHLAEAERLFGEMRARDQLFVMGWRAYLEARRLRDRAPLEAFRAEAEQRQIYESVREADLYLLQVSYREEDFARLYFGTPHALFRRRILRWTGREAPAAASWRLGSGACELDVQTGNGMKGSAHRLLASLARDLYRPVPTGALFSSLFPEERFDVFSSPQRVRQAVRRARPELGKLPVAIAHARGGYRFTLGEDASLLLPREWAGIDEVSRFLAKLDFVQGLTQRQACVATGLKPAVVRRLLKAAENRGEVERYGAASRVKYFRRAG